MKFIKKLFNKKQYNDKDKIISCFNRFKGKVFCIGANKTGTTSIEEALKLFGYNMVNQQRAEMLVEECIKHKNYDRLIRLCQVHDGFQDVPFSLQDIYKILDKEFPNSKFILTIRDSSEQWFSSLVNFHTKLFSSTENPPSKEDLKNATYGYKGMTYDGISLLYNHPEIPLYDKEKYIEFYEKRNSEIIKYFKNTTDKLLIINVSKENSFYKLSQFLGIQVKKDAKFPWKNKT